MEPRISCRHVWKIFGPNPEKFFRAHGGAPDTEAFAGSGYIPAVRDATLDVYPGEILVIMGLSGSGKSTLVRCLSRLDRAHRRGDPVRRARPPEGDAGRDDRAPAAQDGHGVPALRPAAAPHRAAQRRLPARGAGHRQGGPAAPGDGGHRARGPGRQGETTIRASCPADSSSASASPARSPSSPTCGSSTSRSPPSTR